MKNMPTMIQNTVRRFTVIFFCHNLTLTACMALNEFNSIHFVVCILFVGVAVTITISEKQIYYFCVEDESKQCRLNRKMKQKLDLHHTIRVKIRLNIKYDLPLVNHSRFRAYERLSMKFCCKYSMVSKDTCIHT